MLRREQHLGGVGEFTGKLAKKRITNIFPIEVNENSTWNNVKKDYRSSGLPTNHKAISKETQSRIKLEQASKEDATEGSEVMGSTTISLGLEEIKNKVTGK